MNTDHDRNDLDPKMAERFSRLREITPRDPGRTAEGRAAFLAQARELAHAKPRPSPISPAPPKRHTFWTRPIFGVFTKKEMQPAFTKIMAVLIAVVLVFGGAAATAYASEGSLPTDALYGVKTFGENIRLSLAPQASDKLGLALEFTQRRIEEIAALKEISLEIPAHVATQYQEQVQYALRLAAELPDPQVAPALEQIQARLQEQLRRLETLGLEHPDDTALVQLQEQLRQQLRLVQLGLADPQSFREQVNQRIQLGQETEEPGNQNSNFNGSSNANSNSNVANDNGNANDDTGNGDTNDNTGNANDDNNNHNGSNDNDDNGNGNANDDNGNDDNGNDNGGNSNDGGGNEDNGNDNGGNSNDNGGNDDNSNDNSGNSNDNGGKDDNSNDNSGNGNDDNGHGGNDNGGGGDH